MTAKIISLDGMDENDQNFMEFLEQLKEGNSRAIYLIEKSDGTVTVGCSATDRRDIVYSIYLLQQLAQSLLQSEAE